MTSVGFVVFNEEQAGVVLIKAFTSSNHHTCLNLKTCISPPKSEIYIPLLPN